MKVRMVVIMQPLRQVPIQVLPPIRPSQMAQNHYGRAGKLALKEQ